jgi:uncharacterized protein YndB with AHSA1/START domain
VSQQLKKENDMSTFIESTIINAPRDKVWAALADIGTIADWNPGLQNSKVTNSVQGLGATRHCVIDARQNLDEEVVQFEEGKEIAFRITKSSMPFARADIRFRLADSATGTKVEVSPDYQVKYGVLGSVLDLVLVKRMYAKGMRGLLSGLKLDLESNQ